MPKVYIVNYSSANNYDELETIGTPVYVTEGVVKTHPSKLHKLFANAFVPASVEDYLLLTGPTLLSAIAYSEWCRKFTQPGVFVWDKRMNKYVLHQIEASLPIVIGG